MQKILSFLNELEANNNREWFSNNRQEYTETQDLFRHFVEILINEIRSFDKEIPLFDARKCIVRIYRDLRFSVDKSPYKNYYGGFIAYTERNAGSPGYYLHIQPGYSFVSGGIFKPSPEKLKAIRNEIFHNTFDFLEIINEPDFKNNFQWIDDEKLKIAPKGFAPDFEHIQWLRFKSYAPVKFISDETLMQPNMIEKIIKNFNTIKPLNQFLYNAIKHTTPCGEKW